MDGLSYSAVNATQTVDVLAHHVEYAALDLLANGHLNGVTHRNNLLAAGKTVGGVHGDRPNGVFSNVLLGFHNDFLTVGAGNHQGFINLRKSCGVREINVYNRSDYLCNLAFNRGHGMLL